MKEAEATAARLKGNRFYRARRWDKALELYVGSLRARPYTVKTLANIAQVSPFATKRLFLILRGFGRKVVGNI